MKCDVCGVNDAVIFVQQINGTEAMDLHLCADCARKRGISTSGGKIEFSVSGLLNGLFDQKAAKGLSTSPCPNCSLSLDELQSSGRLGCPECAVNFAREIQIILRNHGQLTQHQGRYPHRLMVGSTLLKDRENLKERLRQALSDEDYESAARLRDQIRGLDKTESEVQ